MLSLLFMNGADGAYSLEPDVTVFPLFYLLYAKYSLANAAVILSYRLYRNGC